MQYSENKILVIFPKYFPYTKYEVFLETEIAELSKYYHKIHIFPRVISTECRSVPNNVTVHNDFCLKNIQYPSLSFKDLISILGLFIAECFDKFSVKKLSSFRSTLRILVQKFKEYKKLVQILYDLKLENAVFYSVWFNDWATVLSIAKRKKKINKFYCRAHGFDLYHFRHASKQIPFRKFHLKQVNFVACISNAGKTYLKKEYPKYGEKVAVYFLGVNDFGDNHLDPMENRSLHIITVSNINDVKRLHLVVGALELTKVKVNWTHFGDGPKAQELQELYSCLPSNIQVKFMGRVSSPELMNFYKSNPIDLFVLTSSSEGIPVSIQEAISFGIPVVATKVGGVSEIVKEDWGILLDASFEPSELAEVFNTFLFSKYSTIENRKRVKSFWQNNFNANINFGKFAEGMLRNES